jgi:uncharacterized glyoxalase superfamily protein PhnB
MQTATRADLGQVAMYPILGYLDLVTAIDWLCRVFSFEPLEVMRDEDGAYVHVELRLGDGVIMPTTQSKDPDADNPWDQPLTTQGLYVALDGVDTHYDRAIAEGAEILRPLADTDYGSREYTAVTWRGTFGASARTDHEAHRFPCGRRHLLVQALLPN